MESPKLFISYSWTNVDHEAWVINLASDLRQNGVDVVLDKWDLKEGHDAHAFMEKMVGDPEIKKVLLVCNKAYAEKADGRSGGVGTETQIISSEIYTKTDQSKFVAIALERDELGNPYLPIYYKSRIYIDFSDPGKVSESFDRLLRWVYDEPLYLKPDLGKKPVYLEQGSAGLVLNTSYLFKRATEALKQDQHFAVASTSEYLTMLADNMETLRIHNPTRHFDELVIENIDSFIPYRNEAIRIFSTIAQYKDSEETRMLLHRFFERLIPYLDRPKNISQWNEYDFDNFRFVIHELFLYALATLIHFERFESAVYLMRNSYYVADNSEYGRDVMVSFQVFRKYARTFEDRNKRLDLSRLSLRADLLMRRCMEVGLQSADLLQADFVLFLYNGLHPRESFRWWPETLLYAHRLFGPFELFARSRSKAYFNGLLKLLDISTKEELSEPLALWNANPRLLPNWQFDSFNPSVLTDFERIATEP